MLWIRQLSAGTRVHGGDQHETGRVGQRQRCPANRYMAVLQWLPQSLDDMPRELGKFIQKEHAMMSEGGFARPRIAATAYQSGV